MEIEPTQSHLRCDALPIELPSPWKQGDGEKEYINNSSWCPFSGVYNRWTGLVDWTSGLDYWTDRFSFKTHI